VEESIWKEGVRKDASTKGLGPCYRVKGGICAKKGEDLLIVKRRERRDTNICGGSVKERVHPIFQVTPNITSTFCGKKGWYTKNGARLSAHKSVDNKEWISLTPHHKHIRWSRKEKGVYEAGSKVGI